MAYTSSELCTSIYLYSGLADRAGEQRDPDVRFLSVPRLQII